MPERKHEFSLRREVRFAVVGLDVIDWSQEDAYPCTIHCTKHAHSGSTVLLYAHCTCGWDSFVGDHIDGQSNAIEARLRHLQHQIDCLMDRDAAEAKNA